MDFGRQFAALLAMNLSGLRARIGSVLTIVIGVASAVGVLVSMLSMGTGVHAQAMGNVRADRVVVTALGTEGFGGNIPRDEAVSVRDLAGIRRGRDGKPIVVFQVVVPMEAQRRVTGTRVFFPAFGVEGASIFELRPEIRLTDGRMFRPGMHELIASNACVHQYTGFELGASRDVHGTDWPIVGHFDEGRSQQCGVTTDAETVLSTFSRNGYNAIILMLRTAGDFKAFHAALEADPSLHLEARPEPEATEAGLKQFSKVLNFCAYFVGTIMAIGATLGALNSLYSIVDSRRRELATLRAIGFGAAPIVAAMLAESTLLALPGALVGGALAWLLFHGMSVSPFGYSFQLDVTPRLALIGIAWALVMGLIGGLLPGVRAGRVPVTTALRAT
jgi:putative ABC transport system permease protein